MSSPFEPVVQKYGPKAVSDITLLAMGFVSVLGSVGAGAVVQMIAELPQAERDAITTPRQFLEVALREFNKIIVAGFDAADVKQPEAAKGPLDLSCIQDLLKAIRIKAKEEKAAQEAETRPVYAFLPGNDTVN